MLGNGEFNSQGGLKKVSSDTKSKFWTGNGCLDSELFKLELPDFKRPSLDSNARRKQESFYDHFNESTILMNETMTKPHIVSASNAEELPFLDLDGSEVMQLTPESIVKSGSTTLVRSDSNSRQSQNPNGSLSHNNSNAVHKIIITPPQQDRSEKIFLRSPTRDPRLFESIDDESILQTNITIPDIYYPNSNTISQIDNPSPGPLPELDSKDISFQQIISNNIFIEKEPDDKFSINPTKIPADGSNLIEQKEIFWGPQENPNWSHYKGGVKNGLLEGSGV